MGNKKLKICHIITRMIVGGAQENTLLTIISHVNKGHEVTLITGPSSGPEGELLTRQEMPEFKIIENKHLVREINPIKDLKAYFSLKKHIKESGYDVVHTHSSKAGLIGRAAAYKAKVPFVVHTVHGQAFHRYEKPWKNYIYKFSERWAAKRCHKIYAVAQAMIDQCIDAKIAKASKYKVVYSGMKLEKFMDSKPDLTLKSSVNIPDHCKVVGVVARLFPLKGYEYFIPAAIELAKRYNNVHFLIIGDGIMKDDIVSELQKIGLLNRFSFSGLVPPDEVNRYTALMDMLVHLSLREGLPRTVVQALATGKPAIGYNLDGTPEVIIDGETGYLIKPKDIEGVVDSISKLLEDPDLCKRMGKAGQKLVADKFGWERMGDILECEYLKGIEKTDG